jgi:hypothetical protein
LVQQKKISEDERKMKNDMRKIISIIFALSLCMSMTGVAAFADDGNGADAASEQAAVSEAELASDPAAQTGLRLFGGAAADDSAEIAYTTPDVEITSAGEYTVSGAGTLGNNIAVSASGVTLYLDNVTVSGLNDGLSALKIADGCTVNVVVVGACSLTGGASGAGVEVPETSDATITGSSGSSLSAVGNGGVETQTAVAGSGIGAAAGQNSGKITISGLDSLTATGYGKQASGIGKCSKGGTAGDISLSDIGTLYAQGGCFGIGTESGNGAEGGAGIGGGGNATEANRNDATTVLGLITMSNVQNVTANGGSKSAGIGASYWGSCVVEISGCTIISVTGGATAAAIGSARINAGSYDRVCDITITDTTINEAVGGYYAAAIGTGYNGDSCGSPKVNTDKVPCAANITIQNSSVTAYGGQGGAAIGGGYKGHQLNISIDSGSTVYAVGGYLNDARKMAADESDASAIGTGADGSNGPYTACSVNIGSGANVTALARGDKFAIDTNKGTAESNVTGGANIIQGTFVDTGAYEGLTVSIRNYDSTASAAVSDFALPEGYRSFARTVGKAGQYLVYAADGKDGGVASYFAFNIDAEKRAEKTENNTETNSNIYEASADGFSDNNYLYPATTEIVLPAAPVLPAEPDPTDVGGDNGGTAVIPEETTPLVETPAETTPETPAETAAEPETTTEIPEESTPLAEVPETGDAGGIWGLIAAASGLSLAFMLRRKQNSAE